jgi:Tfp pilus assembly protein PilV
MHTLKHLPAGSHDAAGFSLIEALIASAILLIIALGLLPLFSRSISDNVSGNDATQATNGSRTQVEELLNVPFNNDRMVIPAGAENSEAKTSYTAGALDKTGDTDEGWWADPAGHGSVLWTRMSEVRQYSISDLDDGSLDDREAKLGGTESTFVHFKEVTVVVENQKKTLFGGVQGITLKVIKPF